MKGIELMKRTVIKYVMSMIESGNDSDVEDIVIDGFELGHINIKPRTLIEYFPAFIYLMDDSFATSMLGLSYPRFLLRMIKRGIFNKADIKLVALQFGFNRYALETYSGLSDKDIIEIMNEIYEYRDKYRNEFEKNDEFSV